MFCKYFDSKVIKIFIIPPSSNERCNTSILVQLSLLSTYQGRLTLVVTSIDFVCVEASILACRIVKLGIVFIVLTMWSENGWGMHCLELALGHIACNKLGESEPDNVQHRPTCPTSSMRHALDRRLFQPTNVGMLWDWESHLIKDLKHVGPNNNNNNNNVHLYLYSQRHISKHQKTEQLEYRGADRKAKLNSLLKGET